MMPRLQLLFADKQFVVRLQQGCPDAFQRLLGTSRDSLVQTARYLGVHDNDVEDVVQETMMRLYRDIARCHSPGFVTGALSLSVMEYRRKKKPHESSLETAGGVSEDGVMPLDPPCRHEVEKAQQERELRDREFIDSKVIQTAFSKLNPEMREILELRDVQGKSQSEAAEVMGCCIKTLVKKHNLAKVELRRLLLEPSLLNGR
ncbi:MAG: RNA polymerase sigma factor [Planctomycetes bacterium]|nr:RNA polymerase sigma factor [Planctomycetota bacterium]